MLCQHVFSAFCFFLLFLTKGPFWGSWRVLELCWWTKRTKDVFLVRVSMTRSLRMTLFFIAFPFSNDVKSAVSTVRSVLLITVIDSSVVWCCSHRSSSPIKRHPDALSFLASVSFFFPLLDQKDFLQSPLNTFPRLKTVIKLQLLSMTVTKSSHSRLLTKMNVVFLIHISKYTRCFFF